METQLYIQKQKDDESDLHQMIDRRWRNDKVKSNNQIGDHSEKRDRIFEC